MDVLVILDLEDVGEVRAHFELEVELHRLEVVVRDDEVLDDPVANGRASDRQGQGARSDATELGG